MKRSFLILQILLVCSLSAESQQRNDIFGIQVASNTLLFNDCCFENRRNQNPDLKTTYRLAVFYEFVSHKRLFHDFQVAYSNEAILYEVVTSTGSYNSDIEFNAVHFAYYLGLEPISALPAKIYLGNSFIQVFKSNNPRVEWETLAVHGKLEFPIKLNRLLLSPIVEYSYKYNLTSSINHTINFGLNLGYGL